MKNLVIETIKEQMNELDTNTEKAKAKLMQVARAQFELVMETKQKEINALIDKLNESKNIYWGYDEAIQSASFDFSTLIDIDNKFEQELLEEFLSETHYINCDFDNGAVTMGLGQSITIDHRGDVYDQDSGKTIINRKDYETEEERNTLIEAWMDKTGYFPAVIESDSHGHIHFVDTKKAS